MQALAQVLPNTIEEVAKRKTGRPTKMTPETIARLEEAWLNGATDVQACFIAGIAEQTLNDYTTKHPEYLLRKHALKENIALNATHTVARHVKKDPHLALSVLERLKKETWSPRTELTGESGQPFSFTFVPTKAVEPPNNG